MTAKVLKPHKSFINFHYWLLLLFRFVQLLDQNAHPYMIFRMASHWADQRLEVLVVAASLVTNLLVVLTYGIVPPSLAGLAMSYSIQVSTNVFT